MIDQSNNSKNKTPWLFLAFTCAGILGIFLMLCTVVAGVGLWSWNVIVKERSSNSMILIPGGSFIMGSKDGDADELPLVTLKIHSFYIDKYEVTNEAYQECVSSGICLPVPESYEFYRSMYGSSLNSDFYKYPVIFVDWYMAKSYCNWHDARLPTEAEWEKAARGTDGRIYPWGNEFGPNYVHANGNWWPEAVGSYEDGKSFYGVYDMAGNVQEWVSSLYMPYPYSFSDGRENMVSDGQRVQRGGAGAWAIYRTSNRSHYDPKDKDSIVGFRCARDESQNYTRMQIESKLPFLTFVQIEQ